MMTAGERGAVSLSDFESSVHFGLECHSTRNYLRHRFGRFKHTEHSARSRGYSPDACAEPDFSDNLKLNVYARVMDALRWKYALPLELR